MSVMTELKYHSICFASINRVLEFAQTLDLAAEDIAGLEEGIGIVLAHGHACGGAGGYHVTAVQRHALVEVADDVEDAASEKRCARVLHQLSVPIAADGEVEWVLELVQRGDDRAHGAVGMVALY